VVKVSAGGQPERGERRINETEAGLIRHIFGAYAAGASPKAIAHALNRKGVAGRADKAWGQSTINGNWRRGTGILNKRALYRPPGVEPAELLQEPRITTSASPGPIRDPSGSARTCRSCASLTTRSGRRRSAKGPAAREGVPRKAPPVLGRPEQGHLRQPSGGRAGQAGKEVLSALRERLMDPALLKEFCAESTAYLKHLRGDKNASRAAATAELGKLARDRDRLIQAIKNGCRPQRSRTISPGSPRGGKSWKRYSRG
jgi:site-specific DNA recombinase